jgi:hypothetical protein
MVSVTLQGFSGARSYRGGSSALRDTADIFKNAVSNYNRDELTIRFEMNRGLNPHFVMAIQAMILMKMKKAE